MPEVGEIRRGDQIGLFWRHKYIWAACIDCGKCRWVYLTKGKPSHLRCKPCSLKARRGPHHPMWRGGKIIDKNGYVKVLLSPSDFFHPMADPYGYVREHRLVMAKHLGRCLLPYPLEIVHHKNGIRCENGFENLRLTSAINHPLETRKSIEVAYKRGLIDGLEVRNGELIKEIKLLRWQLKELRNSKTLL